jgi:alcohol dehydrogenase class IV
MMKFEFYNVPRIVFGCGRFVEVAGIAKALGSKAMVVSNAGNPGDGGCIDRLIEMLAKSGIAHALWRQKGEPTVQDVQAVVGRTREESCDFLVGLGGGSAIDCAKAAAGVLGNGGEVLDYMEVIGRGQKITRPAMPWIAIPTTAGTGAEVTRNAVIGCPERGFKASLRSELLFPRAALVDPELTLTNSREVTARSGMDALCQLIEAYTSTGSNELTQSYATHGIIMAAQMLPEVWRDPSSIDAREGMSYAAMLSGICLTNAGLGAVHGLAAPLGARTAAPHGTICGRLLPLVMAANLRALRNQAALHIAQAPACVRYETACTLFSPIGEDLDDEDFAIDESADEMSETRQAMAREADRGVAWIAHLVREMKIPPLGKLGLTEAMIPEIVAQARKSSSMKFNPVTLSDQAMAEVLRKAM